MICDSDKPHYCNEPVSPVQASDRLQSHPTRSIPHRETVGRWQLEPLRHRGDLDTIYAAIINHGGEAVSSEAQFEALPNADQLAIVSFLRTLQMPILPMKKNPPPQMVGLPNR